MKYRSILLFGAPGAGKGTQGKVLGTVPNFFHFACGDAFRNLTIESELGRVFLEYSGKGELVPDEHTITLWRQSIQASTSLGRFNPERDTLVLDGIPRNPSQARMLGETLDVRAIFYFKCRNMEQLVQRLQRRALRENRLDDASLDIIQRRLRAYEEETKPVLDYYGPQLVHHIDADESPIIVLGEIVAILARS